MSSEWTRCKARPSKSVRSAWRRRCALRWEIRWERCSKNGRGFKLFYGNWGGGINWLTCRDDVTRIHRWRGARLTPWNWIVEMEIFQERAARRERSRIWKVGGKFSDGGYFWGGGFCGFIPLSKSWLWLRACKCSISSFSWRSCFSRLILTTDWGMSWSEMELP